MKKIRVSIDLFVQENMNDAEAEAFYDDLHELFVDLYTQLSGRQDSTIKYVLNPPPKKLALVTTLS